MNASSRICLLLLTVAILIAAGGAASGAPVTTNSPADEIRILELQGEVEIFPAGAGGWVPAKTGTVLHAFDRIHTARNSRVALRWSDHSTVPFGASTELEVLPPDSPQSQAGLHLIRGVISFFHRDQPGRIQIITRGAVAGVEGTEFVLAVDDADRTTLSVIDGRVRLGNPQATLVLTNGQQAAAVPGRAPVRTAGFSANQILQWCFYYPGVLNPAELPLPAEAQSRLADSLAAYRTGDLLAALAKYPAARSPGSDAERIYYAALLLSVGQVEPAEKLLVNLSAAKADSRVPALAGALRCLLATVKRQPVSDLRPPELASEYLAASYAEQSRAAQTNSLEKALELARQATKITPDFGFAWSRVAELEFSFGHTHAALLAVERSLSLAPRNAQALALQGFLLAAQNRTREAVTWFDRALAVDSALGNAWLGRGLCRLHAGDKSGGREDLLVAAALEPQRAELRNYLGKAFASAGEAARADKELQLAKKLDPNDPTSWFYSALLNQQAGRINEAIRDLEKAEALNDNRRVYRSQFLLDQDRAVRSANLAAIYRDAGMTGVGLREAGRAVNSDYANYSAHLFLANSYHELRDPNGINLRYETPAMSEYLVANLLAPVSAGPLSPTLSQGEYSKLFTRDGFGVASSTEYLSRGAWTQSGAQYGVFGDFSYDVEAFYRTDPGQRANNDIEQRQLSLTLKQQFTPQDSAYLNVQHYEATSGDVFQYYEPSQANGRARFDETQAPTVSLGYHHEWNPGVHTLFLAARIDDTTAYINPEQPTLIAFRPDVDSLSLPGVTQLTAVHGLTTHENFVNQVTLYTGELQQILESAAHTTVLGVRVQAGRFDTASRQTLPSQLAAVFPDPPTALAEQHNDSPFHRFSVYGYHQWQLFEPLQLIGGLTYDRMGFPENFRSVPISGREETRDGLSPKAGLIWTPATDTAVRFAYTRSLAGASLDQSYQLEPSQVAGFVQSYRSLIPESVTGASAGAKFETYQLSLEQKFSTGTYLGISAELLNSTVRRLTGAFNYLVDELDYPVPGGLRENLDYQEKSLQFTVNQLLGQEWAMGASYRLSQAVLNDSYLDVPNSLPVGFSDFQPRQQIKGLLQQLDLSAIYNHPSGFFTQGEAVWLDQNNTGYTPGLPGDQFWQFNVFVGYRSPRRNAEVTLGLLNVAGQDYHLNPLNRHDEWSHDRTLAVRLQLHF